MQAYCGARNYLFIHSFNAHLCKRVREVVCSTFFFKNISKFYGCLKHRKKPQSKTSKKWLTKWHKQDPKLMTMLHLEMKLRRFRYRIFVGCSSRLFKFSSHQHKRAMKSRKCVEIDTWKKTASKIFFVFDARRRNSLFVQLKGGTKKKTKEERERISNWQFARLSGWLSVGLSQQFIIFFTWDNFFLRFVREWHSCW